MSVKQLEALIEYLEGQPELALGRSCRSKEGRSVAKRLWQECAAILNSVSSGCIQKTAEQWRMFYNEFKHRMLKKVKKEQGERTFTGGGVPIALILTPLQERLYTILERDVDMSLERARHINLLNPTRRVSTAGLAPVGNENPRQPTATSQYTMSLAEATSDNDQARQDDTKKNTEKSRGQMSDSYMWKEQIHTLMKGGESESDISDSENFLTKGAFLLTPSHGLSMEKASAICEKMEFKGCFSLTKTATGILFKFSSVDDYQMVFKKGFHKVTGSRFYRKIAIPCRPQKTFTVYVYDVPDEVPEEDVRHALYKFTSVVEVVRLHFTGSPREGNTGTSTPKPMEKTPPRALTTIDGELVSSMIPKEASSVIRVTLANIEEANILLQNGLDFYGATYFPTELATPAQAAKLIKPSRITGGTVSARVRDLLPVFDQQGFAKFAPPTSRLVKPRSK